MKKAGKTIVVALLFAAPWGAEGQSYAKRDIIKPVSCFVDPVSYDKSTGQLILDLSIEWHFFVPDLTTCEVVTVHATGVDGLEYSGPERWEVQPDTLTPDFSTRLEVTAPPNDTSGLDVVIECGKYQHRSPRYFVTTADTLQMLASNPREWPKMPTEEESRLARLKDYERAKREWEAQQESLKQLYPPEGTMTTGKTTREAGMRSRMRNLSPEDSTLFITLSEKGQMRLLRMRNLERTPLTEQERQIISLDGTIYVRYRGEKKFHVVEGTTDPMAHSKKVMNSVRIAENKDYDITIDLRDPEDYDFAKSLLDSLIPTDSVGFYRALMKRPTLIELINKGIKHWRTRCWPTPCTPKGRRKEESHLFLVKNLGQEII